MSDTDCNCRQKVTQVCIHRQVSSVTWKAWEAWHLPVPSETRQVAHSIVQGSPPPGLCLCEEDAERLIERTEIWGHMCTLTPTRGRHHGCQGLTKETWGLCLRRSPAAKPSCSKVDVPRHPAASNGLAKQVSKLAQRTRQQLKWFLNREDEVIWDSSGRSTWRKGTAGSPASDRGRAGRSKEPAQL